MNIDSLPVDQIHRDLLWAYQSPELIAGASPSFNASETGVDLAELERFFRDYQNHRVGRYFERLIHFWLLNVCKVDLAEHARQIIVDGTTVGEVDFLFRDRNNILTHLETAVKFYLHYPRPHRSASHYIGPNSADTFERKTHRLFKHQLPLSQTHFPDVERRFAIVKGMIFYHPNEDPPKALPERLNTDHSQGVWINSQELAWLTQDATYCIHAKPCWLSSLVMAPRLDAEQLRRELRDHFAKHTRPLMLSQFRGDQQPARRIMVVSTDWPN